jgi:hypothetical protein
MVMSLFMQLLVAAAQWRAFVRVFPSGTDDDTSDEPRPES